MEEVDPEVIIIIITSRRLTDRRMDRLMDRRQGSALPASDPPRDLLVGWPLKGCLLGLRIKGALLGLVGPRLGLGPTLECLLGHLFVTEVNFKDIELVLII